MDGTDEPPWACVCAYLYPYLGPCAGPCPSPNPTGVESADGISDGVKLVEGVVNVAGLALKYGVDEGLSEVGMKRGYGCGLGFEREVS